MFYKFSLENSYVNEQKFKTTQDYFMKKILLPPAFQPRLEIAQDIHERCKVLEPGSKLIPNTLTYRILLNRHEAAEYIYATYGTLKTWDSTKAYNLHPIKSGSKTLYRLYHLDEFLERSLLAN